MALRLTDAAPEPDRPSSGLRLTGAPGTTAPTAVSDEQAPHALRARAPKAQMSRCVRLYQQPHPRFVSHIRQVHIGVL